MKKILQVADLPIKAYPDYTYPLSIILNYEDGFNWMYSNFIQLYYEEAEIYNPIRFYYVDKNGTLWNTRNPLMYYQTLNREMLTFFEKDIVATLINVIKQDYYAVFYVDEFYIKNRAAYQKEHYHHVVFVYGYESEKELFYTSGYDKNMKYTSTCITFEEIRQGFSNNAISYYDDENTIYLMKYNHKGKRFLFDVETVIEQLEEFLYSRDSSRRYHTDFNSKKMLFGMQIYKVLREYLNAVCRYQWDWNVIKPISILVDHKKLMIERIQFLMEQGYLPKESKQLEQYISIYEVWLNIETFFMLYIKKQKASLIDRILGQIDTVERIEKEALTVLIKELKQCLYRKIENHIYSKPVLFDAIVSLNELKDKVCVEFEVESCTKEQEELLIGFSDSDTILLTDDKIQVKFWIQENNLIVKDESRKTNYHLPKSLAEQSLTFIVEMDCPKSKFSIYLVEDEKKTLIVKNALFDNREEKISKIQRFIFSADYLSLYHIKYIHILN